PDLAVGLRGTGRGGGPLLAGRLPVARAAAAGGRAGWAGVLGLGRHLVRWRADPGLAAGDVVAAAPVDAGGGVLFAAVAVAAGGAGARRAVDLAAGGDGGQWGRGGRVVGAVPHRPAAAGARAPDQPGGLDLFPG